jgi:hypothetical protein
VRTVSLTSTIAAMITMSTTMVNKTAAMVCTAGAEAAASPTGSDRDDEKSRHFDEIEIEVLLGQCFPREGVRPALPARSSRLCLLRACASG